MIMLYDNVFRSVEKIMIWKKGSRGIFAVNVRDHWFILIPVVRYVTTRVWFELWIRYDWQPWSVDVFRRQKAAANWWLSTTLLEALKDTTKSQLVTFFKLKTFTVLMDYTLVLVFGGIMTKPILALTTLHFIGFVLLQQYNLWLQPGWAKGSYPVCKSPC